MTREKYRRAAWALLAIGLVATTVFAQVRADQVKPVRRDELVYLPSEKFLNHFTAGMSSVIADLLWLRCVQYMGVEIKHDKNFAWLSQMLNTIVRLDPQFTDVYRFGSIFLSAVKADDEAGLRLLQQGILARPDRWELSYEAAMIYLLNRRDEPGARKVAAHYLGMAANTGKAPRLVAEVAGALQGEFNLDGIESEMWSNLEQSDDAMLRELAQRKQQELGIRQNLRTLDDNIARYTAEHGHAPETLEAVIAAGYFGESMKANPQALLQDSLGGRYLLSPDGRAANTSLLDDERDKWLNVLREGIKRYHEAHGAYPPSLDALVDVYVVAVPKHPYADRAWRYDPATGEVAD